MTTPAPNAYDAATLADDIHQLTLHLALGKPFVAGHDNGGMVPYALARRHLKALRGGMILDVPIQGLEPWKQVKNDPALWRPSPNCWSATHPVIG